ncbi:MAG: hypothetical protein ACRETC_10710, partial [Gammaproteobacteria bacterium]
QTLNHMTATTETRLRAQAIDHALNKGLVAFKTEFARRMDVHAGEQQLAATDRSPAAIQPAVTQQQQARQRLDRLTAAAETGLHTRAIDRALSECLVTFQVGFARRMKVHAQQQMVANRRLTVARIQVIR